MHTFFAQLLADASTILTAVTLGLAGWMLKNQVAMKGDIREIKTRLADLPCQNGRKCSRSEEAEQ